MKANLSKININLLFALQALLKEKHVTRAAKALHMSQAAMSNTLKQLRILFKDELFVRGQASSMLPTPRALELADKINEVINQVTEVFTEPDKFDPKTAKQNFILGLSDYTELVLLPPLMQFLAKEAPLTTVTVKHKSYLTDSKPLEDDDIDLMIGIFYAKIPKELVTRLIYTDRPVCIGWNQNPLLTKPISLKDFVRAPQIIVLYPEERSDLCSEVYLKELRCERRNVIATVPHTLAALYTLPNTNLIGVVPERAAKAVISSLPLATQSLAFPIKGCCHTKIEMVWHPKNRNNPAHRWLRESIIELAKGV